MIDEEALKFMSLEELLKLIHQQPSFKEEFRDPKLDSVEFRQLLQAPTNQELH